MSEQFSPQIPLPPQGQAVDLRWRPVMKETLNNGASFLIDTSQSIGGLNSIGVDPTEFPEGTTVIARISDGVNREEHPEENGIDTTVVKYVNPSGAIDFFLVTDFVDDKNQTNKKWTQIPNGVDLTIGRTNDGSVEDHSFVDGAKLTGKAFSGDVSRKHMKISYDHKTRTLDVRGFGKNGTVVEATKASGETQIDPRARDAGDVAVHASVVFGNTPRKLTTGDDVPKAKAMINSVPSSPDEARQMLQDQERARIEVVNQPIQSKIVETREKMHTLMKENDLSGKDTTELNAYAQAKTMKRKWQESGNGDLSIASSQNMGTALNNMSPQARKLAETWASYQQYIDDLNSRLK